jgi:type IX secretion system PorP/SprF family membrane protein
MPNRILVIIVSFILFSKYSFGQQNPQFSQYIFNQIYYNPAVTGNELAPKITLLHRSQYIGYVSNFDNGGTLTTQSLAFQLPLTKLNSGVGIVIVNDQAGLQKNQQVKLSYSKNFKLKQGVFSVGVSGGIINKSFAEGFRPRESGDAQIPGGGISQFKPDLGLGVYYSTKSIFAGLSLNNITNPTFDYGTTNGKNIINRNAVALVGLIVPISSTIELKPSILVRTDLQTYTAEGGLMANVGKYWLGASYRKQDAAIIMAGLNLMKQNALKLGFAYDLVTSNTKAKSSSSIEILASYVLGGAKPPKIQTKVPIIRTPRYRH